MRVGICGYPGSGKSTVFSALAPGASATRAGVAFGNIKVPDRRIEQLSEIFNPKRKVYAEITFMDVGAGSTRADGGAFPPDVVQHMRNADVLAHVVRGFDSPMHAGSPDIEGDESRFGEELILLDLTVLEKVQKRWQKEARKGPEVETLARCVAWLEDAQPLRTLGLSELELAGLPGIQLLSNTPLITLYNLSEAAWNDDATAELRAVRKRDEATWSMAVCGEMEAEIATLDPDEQAEFLEGLGLQEPARDEFIRTAYGLLDYISFLTVGPDECRAWPIQRGTVARKAAGKVHSDIERGFIRAEVYRYEELLEVGSEAKLKTTGRIRLEGKEYVVLDGDVVNFRFNV